MNWVPEVMANRIFGTLLSLACLCAATGAEENSLPARRPFFRLREHPTQYAGPGRDDAPPGDVDEVLIGYFGPNDPSHPEGGDMWLAAQWAIEEANDQGGYQGKPFRLVPRWSENPWGSGVSQVAQMAYTEKVWAIVGGIDGASTHLAEQVVAKARLPLLSPASTDKTVNLANVPWMFSLVPGDHLQTPVLAAAISEHVGARPFVVVSADDHDSRLFAAELAKCFAARRMVPRYHFQCKQAAPDLAGLVARVVESSPDAVVLVAGAHQSARLLVAVRERGFAGPVFGGPAMGRRRFLGEAGDAAEGVVFPLLYDPREASAEFTKTFASRFERSPDYTAAHTYDAVGLLVAAIRKAGLNRARIRDAVRELSPWSGAAGIVTWDPLGSNVRAVSLGTIQQSRVVSISP